MAFSTSARKLRTGLSVGILIGGLAAVAVNNRPSPHSAGESSGVFSYFERFELAFFDLLVRREARQRAASSDIVFVAIDDASLDYTRDTLDYSWPWPRQVLARLVQEMRALGAKLVVVDLIYPDDSCREGDTPEQFAEMLTEAKPVVLGFNFVKERLRHAMPTAGRWAVLQGAYPDKKSAVLAASGLLGMASPRPYVVRRDGQVELWLGWYREKAQALEDARERRSVLKLDSRSLQAAEIAVEQAPEEVTLFDVFAARNALRVVGAPTFEPNFGDILLPAPGLATSELRFGAVDAEPDTDGVWRTARYLQRYEGRFFPSLALAAAVELSGADEVQVQRGRLTVGDWSVPFDETGKTTRRFYGGRDARLERPYDTIPISELVRAVGRRESGHPLDSRLQKKLDGKIVFITNEAASLTDIKATPLDEQSTGTLGHAVALDNLLRSDGLIRAPRTLDAVVAFFLAFLGAMLSVASTRTTRMRRTAVVELALGGGIVGGYLYLLSVWYQGGMWVAAVIPLSGFLAALMAATAINYADESKTSSVVKDALGRYTSPAIVDEILRNPKYLSLDGDTRVLTVFFSDIRDFTTISERMKPTELVRMLNEYLTAVTEVIGRGHGHVDKFIGDAVMAYWGAPIPNKLHAVDACRCSVQIRDLLNRRREEWKAKYGVELYARAGVNTGEMIVGNMGSKGERQKVNYTVIGDAVNLASRLEGTNKVYDTEILIGEGTFEAAREFVEARELDLVRVKGKQRPVRVFELVCMKGDLTAEHRARIDQFEAGLIAYRKREFAEARTIFQALLPRQPDDGPTKLYLQRCEVYLREPPSPEWDGVFEMAEK